MRLIHFSLLFLLVTLNGILAQPATTPQQYIEKYRVLAVQEMIQFKIPASIKLAQGIVETASGNSNLARLANNHFGIKCHVGWTGDTYHQDDDSANECFRKYAAVADSYRDHSLFLKHRPRYSGLFELPMHDYEAWARGLKAAGYATNPTYAEQLIKVIRENNLNALDTLTSVPSVWATDPIFVDNLDQYDEPGDVYEDEFVIRPPASYELKHFNRIKYVEAKTGDTPQLISESMEIMLLQICIYNDISKTYVFKTGERVYLQPKKRFGSKISHEVKEGETMRDISQQYGIRLKALYRLNKLTPGTQPVPGTTLKLGK
jgi:hypothetical protein